MPRKPRHEHSEVIPGPGAEQTPKAVLEAVLAQADELEGVLIIWEKKDESAGMSWSKMLKRDLWWNVSNACARLYNILGQG